MSMENQVNNWRYEKKYPIGTSQFIDFEKILFQSNFLPSYPSRVINNCYYDNVMWDSFYDNINGLSTRSKLRFRWYDTAKAKGRMEFKLKQEDVNTKKYPPFNSVNNTSHWKDLLNSELNHLFPSLINQYERQYFEDFRGNRLTIDSNLKFAQPTNQIGEEPKFVEFNEFNVIEIKYNSSVNLSDFKLPTPLLKFSKYVMGIKYIL